MNNSKIHRYLIKGILIAAVFLCSAGMLSVSVFSIENTDSIQQEISHSGKNIDSIICIDRPEMPENVYSSDGGYWDKIRTTWDETTCATSYQVYRSTGDASGPYVEYLGETTELFWEYLTTDNIIRWFGIKACNAYGCSFGMPHDEFGGYAAAGFDTIGLYNPDQKKWYLKTTPADGWVDFETVNFGATGTKWIPITGDWNGNGQDTIGLYNFDQKKWYLKNTLADGWVDFLAVSFGSTDTSWIPVTGDWNGDGTDTVGFYVPSQGKWYLKNTHANGWVDFLAINFGGANSSWQAVAGDWDLDGYDEIGFYVPDQKKWYLKNSLVNGWVDFLTINFGGTGSDWIAVAGNWGNT